MNSKLWIVESRRPETDWEFWIAENKFGYALSQDEADRELQAQTRLYAHREFRVVGYTREEE